MHHYSLIDYSTTQNLFIRDHSLLNCSFGLVFFFFRLGRSLHLILADTYLSWLFNFYSSFRAEPPNPHTYGFECDIHSIL